MATDGVKIVEGDLAYDLYIRFMDMYNEEADIEGLQKQFESDKIACSYNKFDYEICITVYALAFWEIGKLTSEMLNEAKTVIAEKATVNYWTKEFGKEVGEERQKELDKLLEKISKPNPKPKRRKKKKTVNLFEVGDVLSFQYPDRMYGIAFVVDIQKCMGFCTYSICRVKYKSEQQPTIDDLIQKGTFIAEEITTGGTDGEITNKLYAWVNEVEHSQLKSYVSQFNKIGRIVFRLGAGQSSITVDYEKFCSEEDLSYDITYHTSLGHHVGEYPISEYIEKVE